MFFRLKNDIIGCQKVTIFIRLGLADAAYEEIFDTALRLLKLKWNLLQKDNMLARSAGFTFQFLS